MVFARDTRPSGAALVAALVDGVKAAGGDYKDFGFFTTPQLHYVTRCLNTRDTPHDYGTPTEEGYIEKLSSGFKLAMQHRRSDSTGSIVVDCANGVGGPKLREVVKRISSAAEGGLDIKIVNDDVSKPDLLNEHVSIFRTRSLPLLTPDQCGADFVKVGQRPPTGYKADPNNRFASFDGDADRLMYYFNDGDGRFHLLDGDRIATLAASFLGDLARQSGLADQLKVAVVQTAYANGASTDYVKKTLNLPWVCTATGVKNLHHAASRYDVGVYFEANGHGTVLFSPSAIKAIRTYEPKSPAQLSALETLQALSELINQTVGDAISDLLLVECILAHKQWTTTEWLGTYIDLPNRLRKVIVPDRNLFKTTDAERKLVSPPHIQEEIDALVAKYKLGRAFARASGTEDAVRVYAEANSRSEADDLALKVEHLVTKYANEHANQDEI